MNAAVGGDIVIGVLSRPHFEKKLLSFVNGVSHVGHDHTNAIMPMFFGVTLLHILILGKKKSEHYFFPKYFFQGYI